MILYQVTSEHQEVSNEVEAGLSVGVTLAVAGRAAGESLGAVSVAMDRLNLGLSHVGSVVGLGLQRESRDLGPEDGESDGGQKLHI